MRNIVCPSHHRQGDVSALHPHDVLLLEQVASALVLWTVGKKERLPSVIPHFTCGTPTQHVQTIGLDPRPTWSAAMKEGMGISHKVPHWRCFLLPSAVSCSDKNSRLIPGLHLGHWLPCFVVYISFSRQPERCIKKTIIAWLKSSIIIQNHLPTSFGTVQPK